MRRLYGFIVGKCKVNPEYFFDEMSFTEIEVVIEAYEEEFRNDWEKTRTLAHSIISSQSTKAVKPEDVLKFQWDDENGGEVKQVASDEDRKRLMEKIKK